MFIMEIAFTTTVRKTKSTPHMTNDNPRQHLLKCCISPVLKHKWRCFVMDIGNTDQLCIIAASRLRFSTTQSIHMHETIQFLLQGWVRFYPTDVNPQRRAFRETTTQIIIPTDGQQHHVEHACNKVYAQRAGLELCHHGNQKTIVRLN